MPEEVKAIVVTRAEGLDREMTIGKTAGDQPNISAQSVPWWKIVAIRAARVYLQSFVGFVGGAAVGATVGIVEAGNMFAVAAQLALFPTVMSLTQNLLELLGRLDEKMPILRG